MSFAQLGALSASIAETLRARRLEGKRVALLASPGRRWVAGFWAIQLVGGSVVPLSPLYPPRETRRLVEQAGAVAVLCERQFQGELGAPLLDLSAFSSELAAAIAHATRALDSEDREAMVLFTSGTTGQPKAVPFDCRRLWAGAHSIGQAWGITPNDVLVHTLPLHHLHGISVALLSTLLAGGAVIFVPRFDPVEVFDACSQATMLMGVPTQHHRLLAHYDALKSEQQRVRCAAALRGLRLLTSGSAKLPESIGLRLQELSGQYPLERYGMTEVGIVISNPLEPPRMPGSCGKPMLDVELRIVDELGREVPRGEAGELWVSAPTVFSGYDGKHGPNRDGFVDGWFKTGDTASQTEDGWVHILGRTSVDIIKSGGYKLSALEMEELLRGHPMVQDVAVVGIPDERWGEKTVAVVVPHEASTQPSSASAMSPARQLRAWAKQRTAAYKVPSEVVFRAQLPRNALGKVSKHVLIDELSA